MHEEFEMVLNNYNFLNPIYSHNTEFIIAHIDSRMLNSNSNVFNYEHSYMQQSYEKHVILNARRYDIQYIKYEFENDILHEMYKIFNRIRNYNVKLITSLDKLYSTEEIAKNIVFKISQYSNALYINDSVIIISPAIYYYIDMLNDFRRIESKQSERHAARCKHVGYLLNAEIHVDYYMKNDMIICMSAPIQEYLSLFFNPLNDNSNIMHYKLEITNEYLFENNVSILVDDVYFDPMENDMTRSDVTNFFND